MITRSIGFNWLWSVGWFSLVAGASACSSKTPSSEGNIDPPNIEKTALALTAFNDCAELETYIEDKAVDIMKAQLSDETWGWRSYGPVAAEDSAAPNASAGASAPTAYTKTNTQVAGVDEADFVKTDGTHIYVISGQKLYINKSWPAVELSRLADMNLEGYPREMFLDDTRKQLVVLAYVDAPYLSGATEKDAASPQCLAEDCGVVWAPATKVTLINVADPSSPVVSQEIYLPGFYQNARRIHGSVRVIQTDGFRWPETIKWYPDYNDQIWNDQEQLKAARLALIPSNEALIRSRSLTDWVPHGLRRLHDGTSVDLSYECSSFHKTNTSVYLGFTTVATVNLDAPSAPIQQTSVVAETNQVYASTSSLYLATQHWWWWPSIGQEDWTYLYKFDLTDPNKANFVAAGGVEGHILNQFSMDEHDGHLRIATNISRVVVDPQHPENPWGLVETSNRVSVLATEPDPVAQQLVLKVVGETPELAPGQVLQSSRFVGNKGFVVTFRQVDPLFTLDLTDPRSPFVVGELHIPGFSSYIHPLDENHLLTIGTYIPEPNEQGVANWEERRMKLSIYDVSDFAHPTETASQLVGTAYGWSGAQWDHKAFNYFPERGLLAIPFSDYYVDSDPQGNSYNYHFTSELRVFGVTTEGFQPKGSLSFSDIYISYSDYGWTWSWSPWVSRSVMADDVVYAISDAGIRAAMVTTLGVPVSTVLFDHAAPGR